VTCKTCKLTADQHHGCCGFEAPIPRRCLPAADEAPWDQLQELFTETWALRVDIDTAMKNVVERFVAMGYSQADAEARVASNDRINAQEIMQSPTRVSLIVEVSDAHLSQP
jgi:pantothenate kinase